MIIIIILIIMTMIIVKFHIAVTVLHNQYFGLKLQLLVD